MDNVSEGRWAKERRQENGISLKSDASYGHTSALELAACVIPYFHLPGFELSCMSRAEAIYLAEMACVGERHLSLPCLAAVEEEEK